MSRWTIDIKSHPIQETFQQIFDNLNIVEEIEYKGDKSEVRRLLKVLTILRNNVNSADLELFSSAEVQQLDNLLKSQVLPNVKNYSTSHNIDSYIVPINNQQALLTNPFFYNQIELPIEREHYLEVVYDTLENDTKAVKAELRSAKKLIGELEDKNTKLNEELIRMQGNVSSTITSFEATFKASEQTRATEFSSSQTSRDTKYNEWAKSNRKILDDYITEIKSEYTDRLDAINIEADEKLATICELYGIVADKSVTGGYAQTAKQESKQFNLWRFGSFIFLVLAISWVVYSNLDNIHIAKNRIDNVTQTVESANVDFSERINWIDTLEKFSVTLMLIFGVFFCSQQATRHRDELRRAKRLELQMTALDPYIQQLEANEKLAIKKQLVDRFFIGIEHFDTKEKLQTPINVIIEDVLNKVKEMVLDITKSNKSNK